MTTIATTAMRQYVPARTVHHSCVLPTDGARRQWTCPVCRQIWSVAGGGGSSNTSQQDQIGMVVAFVMRYPDGTVTRFDVDVCPTCGNPGFGGDPASCPTCEP